MVLSSDAGRKQHSGSADGFAGRKTGAKGGGGWRPEVKRVADA